MQDTMALTLQDMPNEILEHITDYLPVPAKCMFAATCSEYSVWRPQGAVVKARSVLFSYMLQRAKKAINLDDVQIPIWYAGVSTTGYTHLAKARLNGNKACVMFTPRRGCLLDLQVRARPVPAGYPIPKFEESGYSNDVARMYRGAVMWLSGDPDDYVCYIWAISQPTFEHRLETWNVFTRSGCEFHLMSADGIITGRYSGSGGCDSWPQNASLEQVLAVLAGHKYP